MTITAISTPPGVGGIAVIRISGPEAFTIVSAHCPLQPQPRKAQLLTFTHHDQLIDQVVATFFPAPHSYTGQDTVEISCHGSSFVQQAILQAIIDSGARLAMPGEFTQQAFLSGQLDLSQAEAVADLIDATNSNQHQLALSQMRGGYAQQLASLRDQLLNITALLELELDFSQEDVEFANRDQLTQLASHTATQCQQLADSYQQGLVLKEGVTVAIIGEPNVGKSTLLNALLGDDRAIVSNTPGTTRDTVEDHTTISGILYRFVDTAGIRQTSDLIEMAGIQRSIASAQKAQILILLLDATNSLQQRTAIIGELTAHLSLADKHIILINNKCDLLEGQATAARYTLTSDAAPIPCRTITELNVSLIDSECANSLKAIQQALSRITQSSQAMLTLQQPIVSNLRHHQELQATAQALHNALQGIQQNVAADLIAIDLRDALYHLGTITGQITSEEMLTHIFSRFCIGK